MRSESIKARLEKLTEQINQLRNESRLVNVDDIFYYHSKIGQLSEQKNKLNRQLKRMEIK
jgi:uncharacterized phage infection (PIP) family protein YhgE